MDDFVSKSAAYQLIAHEAETHMLPATVEAYERAARIISAMKPEDVRPIIRGRWRFEHGSMICSACEYEYGDDMVEMCREAEDDHAFDFCPHCGVRMEVKLNEST